ncbi:MAG: hypothetical protein WA324_23900 [Bryobacteraceae bacterium]
MKYGRETGIHIEVNGPCVHSMWATGGDQRRLARSGYRQGPGMAGTREYFDNPAFDRRGSKPEDSPTFHIRY